MATQQAVESTPAPKTGPIPSPPIQTPEKYNLLLDTIQTYKTENAKLNNDILLESRINDYKKEDSTFAILTYKILALAYALIYVVFCWALFSYRETFGIPMSIGLAVVFALYPFSIDFVANNIYNTFVNLIHKFDKGNAVFLYKPPEKTPLY